MPRRLAYRRKLTIISVIGVTFVFLALFNLGAYWFLHRIGNFLEESLDARLRMSAQMSLGMLEDNLNNVYDPSEQTLLSLQLDRLRLQNELESAYIINAGYKVLADASPELKNISRGYLLDDSTSLKKIELGEIAVSSLHRVEGHYFKNAYAPLYDLYGNTSILVLEANAHSFNMIRFFRRGLYVGTLISIVLLFMIIIYVTWATRLLVKTETELQQSQRLAAMGQMAATVAHEIRNPLGIIKSTSDVLREKYQDPDVPDEMFDFINEEIGRLNRLVNDFLSFAREPQLNMAEHNLDDLVNDAANAFRAEHSEATELDISIADGPLVALCDRDHIHRVLLNLLINACQAVETGTAHIGVQVERENQRGKVFAIIRITDNGAGIHGNPDEIFNPFFTTKTRGTGLGLAVSKTIIERHGGKIQAGNNNTGGAWFRFSIPLITNATTAKERSHE